MGGWGSGRPPQRRKCEHLLALDIRQIVREGRLHPGAIFGRHWVCGGESSGSITVSVGDGWVRLYYTWTPYGTEPQKVDYLVDVAHSHCHYGGSRPWFHCPRCGSRRAVIYGIASDGRFGCRYCMRLGYASEAESRIDRINRRLQKLEATLGEDGQKPKWMRWRRYERVCAQLDAADQAWGALALTRLVPLLQKTS